ncbi:site-specific integrase [Rhodococcus maanshanensis]|nr:site-specific integrase [Rhodococcus maanshanensis]
MPEQEWEEIGPFVRDIVRRGFAATQVIQVAVDRMVMVTSLVRWALEQGLPLDVEQIFHPATVNRYAVTVAGLSESTRSTRRAALTSLSRRITRAAPWEPHRTVLHYPFTVNPYTPAEVSRLLWWAPRQATAVRRRGLAAVVALGAGAGLRGTEMVSVRSSDVRERGDHVIVAVRGPSARQVPVRPAYADAVLEAAENAHGGHVFHDPFPAVNTLGNVLERCEVPETLRPLTSSRLRSTWECAMIQAVPLPVFMKMSGHTGTGRLAGILGGVRRRTRPWWSAAELDALAQAVPW